MTERKGRLQQGSILVDIIKLSHISKEDWGAERSAPSLVSNRPAVLGDWRYTLRSSIRKDFSIGLSMWPRHSSQTPGLHKH